MTIDEKIELLESQIAETNKLLAEIKKEKENEEKKNTESVLAEYWNCLNSGESAFYVDVSNKVDDAKLFGEYDDIRTDRYSNYLTKEYAEQAQKIKEFNDKLLAFKWCYDRDYKPVFSGDYDNRAYYIYILIRNMESMIGTGKVYVIEILFISVQKKSYRNVVIG